jgi:AcrR family transcriptional regulator
MQKLIPGAETDAAPLRRGRPRAFDRDAALAKATRLFWEKGYEATSISDLTEALGIGAPSLYAAFGSKEALYTEALNHYCESNAALVWGQFFSAGTAREAVRSFLVDSAAVLTGTVVDIPRGCMVTLSSVGSEGHSALGALVQRNRAVTLERLMTRLGQAVADGEIPRSTDLRALARFVQTVQSGMSILARDGASAAELTKVAELAMLGWDARLNEGSVEE